MRRVENDANVRRKMEILLDQFSIEFGVFFKFSKFFKFFELKPSNHLSS